MSRLAYNRVFGLALAALVQAVHAHSARLVEVEHAQRGAGEAVHLFFDLTT